jgi:hypothetical protein
VSAATLRSEVGHSLLEALRRSSALGLPALPSASHACIESLAPHHQRTHFAFVDADDDAFADVQPFVACGIQILDCIVPDVVADYVEHHAAPASPTAAEFAQRLRADLLATADGIALPA